MKSDAFWVNVMVKSQDASFSYIKEARKGAALSTYVTFTGIVEEPIRGVTNTFIQVGEHEVSLDPKTHLGALVQVRPELTFVLELPQLEMSRLVTLVSGLRIVQVSMACQATTRGKALINSWRAATCVEE